MKKLALAVASAVAIAACIHNRLGVSLPSTNGPGIYTVTWGGVGYAKLDGGAATIVSDPIVMGGYVSTIESGAIFTCNSPQTSSGPVEDAFTIQISPDQTIWSNAAPTATALIDGGFADGGIPGWVEIGATAAPFTRVSIAHLAAQAGLSLVCTAVTVPN
jgi:hypothetical protein